MKIMEPLLVWEKRSMFIYFGQGKYTLFSALLSGKVDRFLTENQEKLFIPLVSGPSSLVSTCFHSFITQFDSFLTRLQPVYDSFTLSCTQLHSVTTRLSFQRHRKKFQNFWKYFHFWITVNQTFSKSEIFCKKLILTRWKCSKLVRKRFFSIFSALHVNLDPPRSRIWHFSFSKTIIFKIYETKGKFPQSFCNHKRIVTALTQVKRVEF